MLYALRSIAVSAGISAGMMVVASPAEAGGPPSFDVELVDAEALGWYDHGYPCEFRTFRVYIAFSSQETVSFVGDWSDVGHVWIYSTNGVFHNGGLGTMGDKPPLDLTVFGDDPIYWEGQWDSYVTIGYTWHYPGLTFSPGLAAQLDGLQGDVTIDDEGWSGPVSTDENNRVLLMQLTTPGPPEDDHELCGALDLNVFWGDGELSGWAHWQAENFTYTCCLPDDACFSGPDWLCECMGGTATWGDFTTCLVHDCNDNDVPDEEDIAEGTSADVDGDEIPDECSPPWFVHESIEYLGATGAGFTGAALAIDDATIVLESGVVKILERSPETGDLTLTASLVAPPGQSNSALGSRIGLSGDTAVVTTSSSFPTPGAAYIYERDQGGPDAWGYVTTLTPAGGEDDFSAVAIDGDTVVLGNDMAGAAYVFERSAGGAENWGQVANLVQPGGGNLNFGRAVAISGDTIMIGAPGADSIYLFRRDEGGPGNWGSSGSIVGSDDLHGRRLAARGDILAVGALGAAHVYRRNTGAPSTWDLVASQETAGNAAPEVATDGSFVVTRAFEPTRGVVLHRNEGGPGAWGVVAEIVPSQLHSSFGTTLGIARGTVIAGAPSIAFPCCGTCDSCVCLNGGGAMYVFDVAAPCAADLDESGDVGFADLTELLIDWGPCVVPECPGDLDGSGDLGFGDLTLLLTAWGACG